MKSFHTIAIIIFFVTYATLLKRAHTLGMFSNTLKAHVLFWYPRYLHQLKSYKKIYNDVDLVKIARQQLIKEVKSLYHKPYALIAISWGAYAIYLWLAPYFDWSVIKEFDFVYRECWPYAAIVGWCWGTVRANIWANTHLVKAPSQLVLQWGELYRKGLLANPLHLRLVEKYWYICTLRTAMVHTAEAGLGFGLIKTPENSLVVDACKLPEIINTGQGKLKVDLSGFPINFEAFSQYAYKRLLPYTKFRTISISKSGENSVVNWEIDHNNLPSGDMPYSKAPKEAIEDEPVLGWTGRNFYRIQLKKYPHILVAGNTRMGKSTFYNVTIASLHPNTLILIADPKKDALDFRWLMRDPYGLSELRKMRAGGHDGRIPDFMRTNYDKPHEQAWVNELYKTSYLDSDGYYYYKSKLHPVPMVVVADSENRTKRMAQWLWSEFLRRKEVCSNNDLKNIELTRDKSWFKTPEYFPRVVFMMDESAAFQLSRQAQVKDKKGDLAKLINDIMNDEVFLGGALKMSIIEATQRPSAKVIGEDIRPQFLGISFYTKGAHYEMMFGKNETIDVPPPGEDGAYYGTFVAENQTGGYTYVKGFKIDEIECAKLVWDRATKANGPSETGMESWWNAWKFVHGSGDDYKDTDKVTIDGEEMLV